MRLKPRQFLLQDRPRRDIAKAEGVAHGVIHILGRGQALINHRKGFAHQRMLDAIGQKPRHILGHTNDLAAKPRHDLGEFIADHWVGVFAAHHLHPRHQMRGQEEMQIRAARPSRQIARDIRDAIT